MTACADASRVFITPADSPLVSNLAALWATEPSLAEVVEEIAEPYPVEPSKSGPPTLAVRTADGRQVYLHSRYQPLDEARRLIDPIPVEKKMTFYVLGLGLGYHLEALFARASNEAIFCIFEPDLRMIRTALEHRDLAPLIRSHRLMWFHEPAKAQLFSRLNSQLSLVSVGSETITHAPSASLHSALFQQIETWIGEFAAYCRTSMNTLVLNSRTSARNIAGNIAWYAATPDLARWRDRYRNRPAVIVSAGPSLRKNKHLLPEASEKAVLIAAQTSLQPLLELGVEPHFVTSLDYHDICTRFFEKLPATLRTELIADAKASRAIFNMYTGPLTVIGNDFAESLVRELNLKKATLPSAATVAHLAFYVAEFLGCDPIIFVGQDLGFSDGLCYAPGTAYEDVWRPETSRFCTVEMKQWEQIIRERLVLRKILDWRGQPMYTEERLFAYLHQFERDFANSRSRILDCTEGGAAKRGATAMTLREALDRFCTQPLPDIAGESRPTLRWDLLDQCLRSVSTRREEAVRVAEISGEVLPLLEEIRDHLDDQVRVNQAIARIDELRLRMEENGRTYEQVMQFSQESELRRFEKDRALAAEKIEGFEKQKRQVERDIVNVRAVGAAAREFQKLMDEISAHLARFAAERSDESRKEAA
jgi:hypothetical protein